VGDVIKPNPECPSCKGTGLIVKYWTTIDDNDVEPCECVEPQLIEFDYLGKREEV
jgi:hypothetical protein